MINKKIIMKVTVPMLITAVIAGIWLFKRHEKKQIDADTVSIKARNLPDNLKEADFSFEQTVGIDMEKLLPYGLPILIDYGSAGCGPCRQMAPALKQVHGEYIGRAFIKYIDVWKYPQEVKNIPLQVIPTQFFFYADGKPFVPSRELADKIEFSMYSEKGSNEHIFTIHHGILTADELRNVLNEMEGK